MCPHTCVYTSVGAFMGHRGGALSCVYTHINNLTILGIPFILLRVCQCARVSVSECVKIILFFNKATSYHR